MKKNKIKVEDLYANKNLVQKALKVHLGFFYYLCIVEGKTKMEISDITKSFQQMSVVPIDLLGSQKEFQRFSKDKVKIKIDFDFFQNKKAHNFLINSLKYTEDLPESARLAGLKLKEIAKYSSSSQDTRRTAAHCLLRGFDLFSWMTFFIENFNRMGSSLGSKVDINCDEIELIRRMGELSISSRGTSLSKDIEMIKEEVEKNKIKTDTHLTYEYLSRYLSDSKGVVSKYKTPVKLRKHDEDIWHSLEAELETVQKCCSRLSKPEKCFTFSSEAESILMKSSIIKNQLMEIQSSLSLDEEI